MLINKLIATFFLLISCAIEAGTLQGKVVGVADGDSLTVLDNNKTQHKIRLQGIDAPEKAQAFGQKSKQSLHQLVHNKQVTVEFQKKDKYGRTVGMAMTFVLSKSSLAWLGTTCSMRLSSQKKTALLTSKQNLQQEAKL